MMNQKGFSLVELVTVLAIVGVVSGILYTVFFMNWQAFDMNIAQADLGAEYEQAVETIVNDSRFARQINVTKAATNYSATFIGQDGLNFGTYTIKNNGQLTLKRSDTSPEIVLTSKLDYAQSEFKKNGSALRMTLAFTDQVFTRPVSLKSSVDVYPRN